MNKKIRALLVIFLLLGAQLACQNPLPGQPGPEALYTFTSIPPFPTATETLPPIPTATAASTLRPTSTMIPTKTPFVLPTLIVQPKGTANTRQGAPMIARFMSSPPKLDGDWGEWKMISDEYPANILAWDDKQWDGADDLSASFHLGWDDQYLYLAIKVRDVEYVQNASPNRMYDGDSLELLFDTQLEEDFGTSRINDDDFLLGLSAGQPRPGIAQAAYLWAPNWLAGDAKTVIIESRQESGLYRVEAAIPWKLLQMDPIAGRHYGFGISVSDNDNGDASKMQSMVSSLPDRDPTDPTTWGNLLLLR